MWVFRLYKEYFRSLFPGLGVEGCVTAPMRIPVTSLDVQITPLGTRAEVQRICSMRALGLGLRNPRKYLAIGIELLYEKTPYLDI